MLQTTEMSVVVQGAVDSHTVKCLSSVRRHLPGAELILSTWEGNAVEGLDADRVISNADPGPSDLIRLYPFEQVNNVNRQIVSSREGIKMASRKYVLKIRADGLVLGRGFLKYYDVFGATTVKDSVFQRRILVDAQTSTFSSGAIGDWWQFGLRKDMLLLWDIPLYPDRRGEEYFLKPGNAFKKPYGNETTCRFFPEVWIPYQCCRKFNDIEIEHVFDHSPRWQLLVSFLENNFLTIEHDFSDIRLPEAENRMSAKPTKKYLNYRRQVNILQSSYGEIRIPFFRSFFWWLQYTYIKCKSRRKSSDYIYFEGDSPQPEYLQQIECVPFSEKDVSFVVSGYVDEQTKINLKQIRKTFPQSKIILSIDSEQDVSGLPNEAYDELIQTPIMEEYHLDQFCSLNTRKRFTYNKQQVEVRNGLLAVKTTYAVRLRNDCYIKEAKLFRLYKKFSRLYSKVQESFRLFQQKILVANYLTGCLQNDPGCLSDCFALGLTKDLLKLYTGRLMTLEDINFFRKKENRSKKNPNRYSHRFRCEQFFYLSLLKERNRAFDEPESYCVWQTEQAMLFEKYLTSNFIVCSFQEMGICSKFEHCTSRGIGHRFLEKYIVNVDPKNESLGRVLMKEREKLNIFEDISKNVDSVPPQC